MKLGWRFALTAVALWLVVGCLMAPFFSDSVDPFRAGLALGRLSPFVGALGFGLGRFFETR